MTLSSPIGADVQSVGIKGILLDSPMTVLLGLILGFLVATFAGERIFPSARITNTLLDAPDLIERTARFAPALVVAQPGALEDLRSQLDAFDAGQQDTDRTLFALWWTRFDPKAANAWAITVDERTSLGLQSSVLRAWARQDPSAALGIAAARFYVKNPDLVARRSGLWMDPGTQAALIGWDESLIPGIEEWIFDLADRHERQGLMEMLARLRVIKMDPDEVWNWAAQLPPEYARDMLPRVASALAERNPEEAARLAVPHIDAGEFIGLPRRITTRWAKRDPRAALEWLATIPQSHDRHDGVTECARTWLSSEDRSGFMDYMQGRAEEFPVWLEPAFGLYARALMRDQRPEAGLAIAAKIQFSDLRNYTVTLILRHWLTQDEAAAQEWIEEADIPEEILRRARFRSDTG